MISRLRLSPSGPFVGNPPLEVGSDGSYAGGSAGLIWRQLQNSTPVDITSVSMVEILSSMATDGFYIPVGYRYELEASLFQQSNAAPANTVLGFEYSLDDGNTWLPVVSTYGGGVTGATTISVSPAPSCDALLALHVVRFNATALVVTAGDGIRIRLVGRNDTQAQPAVTVTNAWMRVTQWSN